MNKKNVYLFSFRLNPKRKLFIWEKKELYIYIYIYGDRGVTQHLHFHQIKYIYERRSPI